MFVYVLEELDYECYEVSVDIFDNEQLLNSELEKRIINYIDSYDYRASYTYTVRDILDALQRKEYREALDLYDDMIHNGGGSAFIPEDCGPRLRAYRQRVMGSSDDCDNESVDNAQASVSKQNKAQEAACSHCGRMNDVGISECWYCGNAP